LNRKILNIDFIRECTKNRKIIWTKHCLNRIDKRNILIKDIKYAIGNGKIIECYYDDYPYPSCLIFGYNLNNRILHIVCGVGEDIIYMITAYYPDKDKWEYNMELRREQ